MPEQPLDRPGYFLQHRSLSGAAAADSTTLSDANFPLAVAFSSKGAEKIFVYWTGTGGALTDTLDLEPLIRDGINNVWIRRPKLTVKKDLAEIFELGEAAVAFIRIDATATTATAVKIRVSQALRARPL